MSWRIPTALAIMAIANATPAADEVKPGIPARIAGDGPGATYYLAKDIEAGTVVNHLHTLEYYKRQGEPRVDLGFHIPDIDAALSKVRTQRSALEKRGRIVSVPYNLRVTTLETEQEIRYDMFPDTQIAFGRGYTATLRKVRVDDGPLKGKEFYARRLVDRAHVVASDRAWLRAPGMKAVAVSDNQVAVKKFWTALANDDNVASAQAYIDGNFTQVPLDTECEVVALSADHLYAKVRVTKDGEPREYWVLATIASLDKPR